MTPECPPTTVIGASAGLTFATPETKRAARTTSSVVTPKRRRGSKTPAFSKTEATIGTVELTGLEMTRTCASGETRATADARSRTMDAFVWKNSQHFCQLAKSMATHVEKVITGHL